MGFSDAGECLRVLAAALAFSFCVNHGLTAQMQTPDGAYHLKVYEDLVQLPVLVMNTKEESYQGLGAEDFRIQLDSGPAFVPKHSRVEGDDPLTVALVLDDTDQSVSSLLNMMGTNLMPAKLLGKDDRLVPFAFDCTLIRATVMLPYEQKPAQEEVHTLLNSPALHTTADRSSCKQRVHLWDTLAQVGKQLTEFPGRHVTILVTNGVDGGSRANWEKVREYLCGLGVTVFAIRLFPECSHPAVGDPATCQTRLAVMQGEDTLSLFVGGTGGLTTNTNSREIAGLLQRMVSLVRHRYILEFNRARDNTPGLHNVDVTVPDREARVRTGGVTVPVRAADSGDLSEPAATQTSGPVMGNRKVLQPKP